MKVLVTGGSGLVGSAIQHQLGLSEEYDGHVFFFPTHEECDLTEFDQVLDYFRYIQPDIVIHLANMVGGLYANMKHNYNFLIENTMMNSHILQACEMCHVKRLVNILSTCVFPDNATLPLTSDQILNSQPHESNYGYAYSKRWLYIGSKALVNMNTNIEIVNLIPTNLYGENDNFNLEGSHVIPGLIHKCFIAKQQDSPFVINGNGLAKRQFVYSQDFAKIILHFIHCQLASRFENVIVSPPEQDEVSIKSLIDIIIDIFKFDGTTHYDITRSNGQIKKTATDSELRRYLPNFQFTPLQTGLENVIQHFKTYFANSKT